MNKFNKILIFSFLLVFLSVSVFSLTENDPNTVAYYSADTSTDNLTIFGTPIGTGNYQNGLIDFDGSTDYLQLGSTHSGVKNISFGFNSDIILSEATNGKPLIQPDSTNLYSWLYLGKFSGAISNELVGLTNDATGSNVWYWDETDLGISQFSAGTQYNISIVWVSASSNYRLYLDGVDKGLATKLNSPTEITSWVTPYFGKRDVVYFNGKVDYLRLADSSNNVLFETDMSFLTDYTGNNQLTNNGASINTQSILNSAYSFDGTNDYQTNPHAFTSGTEDFTYGAWFKTSSTSNPAGNTMIITKDLAPFHYAIYFQGSTGYIGTYMRDTSDTNTLETLTSTDYYDAQWHHYVVTYTHSTNTIKSYIDGVNFQNNTNVAYTTHATGKTTVIGARTFSGTPSLYFDGLIDEISIWNKTLSQSEITELYNSGAPTSEQQYPYTPLTTFFTITLKSLWDSGTLTNFTATVNGTLYDDNNSGIITTNLTLQDALVNITVNKTDWYSKVYTDYNISSNLLAYIFQTNITFNFLYDSGDYYNLTNIILTDNVSSNSYNISSGSLTFSPDADSYTFFISDGNSTLEDTNFTLSISALEVSTTNITIDEYDNILTFIDAYTSNPIENATVTVTYPSSKQVNLITNSTGQINFSYDYDGSLEFGDYEFYINKLGFINMTFSETINETNIPFIESYNVSRANLIINIYDRLDGTLLSGVNVSVDFVGVFNETTTTGNLSKNNLSIVAGEYAIFVGSEGYRTEQRTFTYSNQEELELDFYLLNLTQSNIGVLTATTSDNYFRKLSGEQVDLLEYKPSTLSFVSVSQCITNVDGECDFFVELNTKIYYLRSVTTIDGVVYIADTNEEGEIFTNTGEIRNLIFTIDEGFDIDGVSNLIYDISESFINNISEISVSFINDDATNVEVCVEYFKLVSGVYQSVTGTTYCLTSSNAVQNIDTSVTLNRSNTYKAEIFIERGDNDIPLMTYYYPSVTSTDEVFNNNVKGAIILFIWLGALAFSLHSKNLTLFFVFNIILSWVQLIIFPSFTFASISVINTIISFGGITISRKVRDFQ